MSFRDKTLQQRYFDFIVEYKRDGLHCVTSGVIDLQTGVSFCHAVIQGKQPGHWYEFKNGKHGEYEKPQGGQWYQLNEGTSFFYNIYVDRIWNYEAALITLKKGFITQITFSDQEEETCLRLTPSAKRSCFQADFPEEPEVMIAWLDEHFPEEAVDAVEVL